MLSLLKRFHNSSWTKRILSLCLALAMVFALLPAMSHSADALAAGDKVYLVPNANWKVDNARFAIYYFNSSGATLWVDMTDSDGDGVYESTVPGGFTTMIFCRMSPSATANNWNNKWNQTADLPIPTDGTNCYTVKAGTWDKGGGTWSTVTTDEGGEDSGSGETTPAEYCLVGFINGADDGNGDDYASTNHKFVNGSLTMTFTETSYVFVKTTDNANWYMTQTFTQGTTATLYNTSTGAMEKMQVPAGEVTFTLVENSAGTLTLSYTVVCGGYEGGEVGENSASDFYLFGYIDRADYGVGDDYATLGKYGFDENGKLTTSFVADSYVGVKSADLSCWYQTDGWKGSVTSATLIDSNYFPDVNVNTLDKLFVPGGVEITFTLTVNNDHTVTLSYEADTLQVEDTSGIQDGTTLHAWNWSFNQIASNMEQIAEMGFTAIQTSPVQPLKEPTNLSHHSIEGNWWVYYQPVDFVITTDSGNALGTKTELEEMIAVAHEYGIKVIVDVVANHLGNATGNDLAEAIPDYLRNNDYWHDITADISQTDYANGNRAGITGKCMGGLPDLNTANKDVQNYVLDFLKECIDIGVDGFRFDAAKHIETPDDAAGVASDFWPTVIGGARAYAEETRGIDLYCYGETLDEPGGMLPISAYTKYMSVTDNSWGNTLRGNIAAGTAAINEGYNKVANPGQLVVWAESHDTFADGTSSGVTGTQINRTWALVAARADVMGLYLARPASVDDPIGNFDTINWTDAIVKAVNQFHTHFVGQDEIVSTYGDLIYIERGTSGVVIVAPNAAAGQYVEVDIPVYAMEDGTYTDQLIGMDYTVSNGRLTGTIRINGVSVVYNKPACAHENTTTTTLDPTCEAFGQTYVQCDDCGAVLSVVDIQPTGHDLTYTDNGNDHTVTCSNGCGYDVTEGHTFVDGACDCGAIEAVEPETITVYAINSSNWSTVNAYVWCSVGSYEVAWPGTAMTKTGESVNGFDVYTYTFDASYDQLIFNNNSGSQTNTLEVMDGKYYDIKTATWYDSLEDVPVVDPLATDVYIAGEFNSWSTLANEFKKANASDTVATLTLELAAETTYQFKIVNNGTWTSCVEAITGDVSGISFSEGNNTNATITTAAAGIYTFTFDLANNTLSVDYPEAVSTDPTETAIKFGYAVSFDSDLKMNYRIKLENIVAAIPNYTVEGAYLTVEKDQYFADGTTGVDTQTLTGSIIDSRLVFTLNGIQSVEMGSELRAVLHIFDTEGNEYYTPVDIMSIKA